MVPGNTWNAGFNLSLDTFVASDSSGDIVGRFG